MSENQIDLRRLPVWLQYVISLTVLAIVVALAWFVGGHKPAPYWIAHYLVPILGVTYILLVLYVILSRRFLK
jgi:Na+/alanine symporter